MKLELSNCFNICLHECAFGKKCRNLSLGIVEKSSWFCVLTHPVMQSLWYYVVCSEIFSDAFRPTVNPGNPLKPPSALWKNLKQTNDIQHGLGAKGNAHFLILS